jgi:putative membrane protein
MYGPWQGNPPGYVHDDAWWGFFHLLPIVLFLLAIGVAIWAVIRFTSRPIGGVGAAAAVVAPPRDAAVEELRVRYARGELGREDFAQRMRDLGGHDVGPARSAPDVPPEGVAPAEGG